METKINIAAILKDKPQGTKLYDWLHNIDVELDTISTTDTETVVWCTNETNNNTTCHRGYSEFGTERGYPDGLQILFPSKEMRDWAKFSWKKGDVLVSKDNVHIIFEKFEDDTYTRFKGKHYLWEEYNVEDYNKEETKMLTSVFEKASDDVAQTYIKTVEERLGGKLNLETLEIEKPKQEFKDGDIVAFGESVAIYKKFENDELYFYACIEAAWGLILSDSVNTSLEYRLATDSEKQQLFDTLTKEGKRWNPDTKQIEDLPKKCELKPFDKVLVKIAGRTWTADFFSHYDENDEELPYVCIGYGRVTHCIPYNEETKHLLGTTDEWKGGEQ